MYTSPQPHHKKCSYVCVDSGLSGPYWCTVRTHANGAPDIVKELGRLTRACLTNVVDLSRGGMCALESGEGQAGVMRRRARDMEVFKTRLRAPSNPPPTEQEVVVRAQPTRVSNPAGLSHWLRPGLRSVGNMSVCSRLQAAGDDQHVCIIDRRGGCRTARCTTGLLAQPCE